VKTVVAKVLATPGIELNGKTPEATISAMIYTEAKKEDGAIRKAGRGLVEARGLYRAVDLNRRHADRLSSRLPAPHPEAEHKAQKDPDPEHRRPRGRYDPRLHCRTRSVSTWGRKRFPGWST
jgi:hypothetical protein